VRVSMDDLDTLGFRTPGIQFGAKPFPQLHLAFAPLV
jgi:hypothetical protein